MIYQLEADYNSAFKELLKYEGKFQAQKSDSGNFYNGKLIGTNYGITPGAYKAYYKKEPTAEIIKSLTPVTVSPIYKKNYWDKIRGDEINNDSVAKLFLDAVVNSGTSQIKSIKHIINATGGKKTVAETSTPLTSAEVKILNALPQDIVFKNFKAYRETFYKELVKKKPTNSVYLKGWLSRLNKHVYSGAVTKSNRKTIIIGLGLLAVGATSVYIYKKRKRRLAA
jgi:lysozyme family protein